MGRVDLNLIGLKYLIVLNESRPVWGAWIEIIWEKIITNATLSRAPYGARGLKYPGPESPARIDDGRAPYGARGLK